ncbi:MAG: CHAT domain-containing protein [Bacteroidota bacterium]
MIYFMIGSLWACSTDATDEKIGSNQLDQRFVETLVQVELLQDELAFDVAIDTLAALRMDPLFAVVKDTLRSNVFHKYGLMLFNKEDYQRAILQLDTAIAIRSNIKAYPLAALANSYYLRAQAKNQLKDETSIIDIQQAIAYLEQTGDQKKLLRYYIILATALRNKGDFGQAQQYYQKVLDDPNAEEDPSLMAMLYSNLGGFYALQRKLPEQRESLQKALRMYTQMGAVAEREYFATAITLGTSFLYEQKWQEAENYFVKLLDEIIASERTYYKLQDGCLNSLAFSNVQMKKPNKAREYYTALLKLSSEMSSSKHTVIRARAYEGLGDIDILTGNFTAAISQYHKAVQCLFVDFQIKDVYATPSLKQYSLISKTDALRILDLKAEAHTAQFEKEGDQKELVTALQIFQGLDELLTNVRQEFKAASSSFNIVKESIPVYEKASLLALQLYDLNQDQIFLQKAFDFATKNKAIVLQDGLRNERAKYAGVPAELIKQENNLKKEYYQLETAIIELEAEGKKTSSLANKKNKRFEIIRQYEKFIQQLEEDYPKYYQLKYELSEMVDPNDIAAQLPEQTAVIEFFVGRKHLFIFCISSKGLKHYVLPKPRKLFTNTREFRRILQDSDYPAIDSQYQAVSQYLYQSLFETPLGQLEQEQEIKRLIIIPDNQLLQVSFDALLYQEVELKDKPLTWDNPQIPYLLNKYAISYAYSNKLLFDTAAKQRIQKASNPFAGFGLEYDDFTLEGINKLSKFEVDTTLSRGMGKLFHSISEIEEAKNIIGAGKLWRNEKATKTSFLKYAPKSQILHLAMHGYESDHHPLNSALIFTRKRGETDYLLKAADLYTLSLSADMTVLSACHTASGRIYKGEGVRSLARAFRYAGCPSLIATLWSVSDYSTKQIIVDFYRQLKDGASRDLALQQAKLNYIRRGQPSQKMPYYWTHLVLIGETDQLEL